jgi:Fic family protein
MYNLDTLKNKYMSLVGKINLDKFTGYKITNEFGYTHHNEIASVFSNNIEGNSIDLNTFFNFTSAFKKKKEKSEIDDLAKAYEFAQNNTLTLANLKKAHKILTKSSLELFQQGKFKVVPNGLFGSQGLIYLACPVEDTKLEMDKLFELINGLKNLSNEEVFFYASFVHLRSAHIHPFIDGNGRIARLIEKWFLAQYIGEIAFLISSEEYYFTNRQAYYSNLNIGPNYDELDYSKSINFLLMLQDSCK